MSLTSVTVTDLTSTTAGEGQWLGALPGTRGDDVIGANTAVLISYPSTLRYKGGHPRTYLLAGGNADNQDGVFWHSAFQAEVATHWTAFLTGCVGISASGCSLTQFCAIRYRGKFLPNGGPPHYYLTTPLVIDISPTSLTVSQQMASQRRRIGRVRA